MSLYRYITVWTRPHMHLFIFQGINRSPNLSVSTRGFVVMTLKLKKPSKLLMNSMNDSPWLHHWNGIRTPKPSLILMSLSSSLLDFISTFSFPYKGLVVTGFQSRSTGSHWIHIIEPSSFSRASWLLTYFPLDINLCNQFNSLLPQYS